MLAFPNGKINLGLNVLRKREDGFHDIETLFYPVALSDALEVIKHPYNPSAVEFTCTGLQIKGEEEDNLCLKAYQLLKKDFPQLPAVKIHLHKAIPLGAGLGGGSADAAFLLNLLNSQFGLSLSSNQLFDCALQLGSDCPFFMVNKPCFASGRGEIQEEIPVIDINWKMILVNPGIHVGTGWAFSQVKPSLPQKNIRTVIQQPMVTWRTDLTNDFENAVFTTYPQIKKIKEELYNQGAIYAAMSGSGSTVFGIFDSTIPESLFADSNYFIKRISSMPVTADMVPVS